jgi:zinc resistance-associated protein
MMKKLMTTLGIVMLVSLFAVPVLANRWGASGYGYRDHPGPGPCWIAGGDVSESQRAELQKLEKKFFDETAQLREQIWEKSRELNTLLDSPSPDAKKVRTLQSEISDLKAKMAEKRVNYELEARKVAPNARFGRGYGRGYEKGRGMGYHHGPHHPGPYGHGGMHYGYGYGPCWR